MVIRGIRGLSVAGHVILINKNGLNFDPDPSCPLPSSGPPDPTDGLGGLEVIGGAVVDVYGNPAVSVGSCAV